METWIWINLADAIGVLYLLPLGLAFVLPLAFLFRGGSGRKSHLISLISMLLCVVGVFLHMAGVCALAFRDLTALYDTEPYMLNITGFCIPFIVGVNILLVIAGRQE